MVIAILTLFGFADIATCIYLYLYYRRLSSDICKSKYELNQIKKEMGGAK